MSVPCLYKQQWQGQMSAVETTPSLQPQAVSRAIQRVDIDAASATATGSRLWFRLAE